LSAVLYGNYIHEVLFIRNFETTPYYGWYLYDLLYSPVALVDYYGNINERYEYDVYGNPHIMEPNFTPDPDGKSDYDNPYYFQGKPVKKTDSFKTDWFGEDTGMDTNDWFIPDPTSWRLTKIVRRDLNGATLMENVRKKHL